MDIVEREVQESVKQWVQDKFGESRPFELVEPIYAEFLRKNDWVVYASENKLRGENLKLPELGDISQVIKIVGSLKSRVLLKGYPFVFPTNNLLRIKVKCKFCENFVSKDPGLWICDYCSEKKIKEFVDYFSK